VLAGDYLGELHVPQVFWRFLASLKGFLLTLRMGTSFWFQILPGSTTGKSRLRRILSGHRNNHSLLAEGAVQEEKTGYLRGLGARDHSRAVRAPASTTLLL
jgi:hypothetical protein